MPTFPVPNAQLDYELSDEGGMPVVQLHGLTSSRARDRVLKLDLGSGISGTRLLRYDARGHGYSTGRAVPSDYSWPALADDLLALLRHEFGEEPVHAVGQSMGAGTILHAALKEPQCFRSLTLLLPPTAWETRAAKKSEYEDNAQLVESEGLEGFVQYTEGREPPPAAQGRPATRPDVSEELLPSVFRGAAMSDLPALEKLASVEIPVLILAWIEDAAHPISTAKQLVETLPNAQLSVAKTPEEVQEWPSLLASQLAQECDK